MLNLQTPLNKLIGIGPETLKRLKNLGLETVADLIFYFPRRYDDFLATTPISKLRIGETQAIAVKIDSIKNERSPKRRMIITQAKVSDPSGQLNLVWFNQPYLAQMLAIGTNWIFYGKVSWDFSHQRKIMAAPLYEKEAGILPVYGETEKLSSKILRRIIKPLLKIVGEIPDYFPADFLAEKKLVPLTEALRNIHFPLDFLRLEKARERLSFDELFFWNLRLQLAKKNLTLQNAPAIKPDEKSLKKFTASLPYQLTNAQRKTAWEIILDLQKSKPMNRLLEGDVGSGKTVVAAMAALAVGRNGYQTIWLAPTEILAIQHYENVSKMLEKFGLKIALVTAKNKKLDGEKISEKELDEKISGANLIIGTHALLNGKIKFEKLALIIIDEQHRFGVKQRAELKSGKGYMPHFLSMSATPIPRTLALALFSDLDLSIIDEMPKGRQKVETKIIQPERRKNAYEFIAGEIKKGRQVFVVCPLIQKTEDGGRRTDLFGDERKTVLEEYEKLSKEIFPQFHVAYLHGKMKAAEKEKTMADFKNGKYDILVSTSVIEVGVDVPNATVMMIEGAERFGLAQLHQFRGRVGRGEHQAHCLLFVEIWSDKIANRLRAFVRNHDGFKLAEEDLKLRGPGDLIGMMQSGMPDFKIASLGDAKMIEKSKRAAEEIVAAGVDNFPKIKQKLSEFYLTRHLE